MSSLGSKLNGKLTRRSFTKMMAATGAAVAFSGGTSTALADDVSADAVSPASDVEVIRTMCRGCGKMECVVWVTVENGRAVKIEGDESCFASYGNCCTKSQASLQACYHPDRVAYPMKRTNAKGEDDPGWERISWDEALSTAATKFQEILDKRGEDSMFSMCGTSRFYCMQSAGAHQLILNTVNTHQAYQICKGPRHVASGLQSARAFSWMATTDRPNVFVAWGGSSEMSNYDESCRSTVDIATKADYHIIVDPRLTNMGKEADYWLGLRPGTDDAMALGWLNVIIDNDLYDDLWVKRWTNGPFLVCDDIEATGWDVIGMGGQPSGEKLKTTLLKESDIKEDGDPHKFIVFDQLANDFTYFDSTTGYWENEQPWTVGKYEAMQRNLPPGYSQGYVNEMSEFNPQIDPQLYGEVEVTLKDGKKAKCTPVWQKQLDYLAEFPLDKVAEITGVDANLIEEAAKTYATRVDPSTGYGNGGIQYMLAVEHAANSIQTCRMLDLIIGITGNFDTPAGHRGATTSPFPEEFAMMGNGMSRGFASYERWGKLLGVDYAPFLQHITIWGDSTAIWDACNEQKPYGLYGAICQSGDVMNMSNSLWAWEGLSKLDFLLDYDLWRTPTSQLADVFVPVRHWLELDCPRRSQGSGGMEGSHFKCIEALGETWFDVDITIKLAEKMGVPWYQGEGAEQWGDSTKEFEMAAQDIGFDSWADWKEYFQEHGNRDCKVVYPDTWGTYRRYETGGINRGIPGLSTPTLKQEIWSTWIESYGYDRSECIAQFMEPPEGPVADPEHAKEYPLIMTTGRRIPVYFHSEHRQLPWCRENWPVPRIEMNPADAEELGVTAGDWVWIETPRAKIRQCVDLYYGINKGVVNCEHQWWLPEFKGAMKGYDLINVNALVNKDIRDRFCGSSYARAYNVKVYKATPENSPYGNPIPCDVDGTPMISSADDPRLKEWAPDYERTRGEA